MDAVFGEVKIIPPCDGLSKVNQLIVRYPELSPPLVEKMRLHLSLFDWQLTIDTANRILTMDPKNLTALKVFLLFFYFKLLKFWLIKLLKKEYVWPIITNA